MSMYCTRCNINWGAVWNADDEHSDESYMFCPTCGSDSALQTTNCTPAYMAVQLTGKIIDIRTGQELWKEKTPLPGPPAKVRPIKVFTETKDEYETRSIQAEDKFLDEYVKLCEQHPSEQAWRIAMQNREKVTRLFTNQ